MKSRTKIAAAVASALVPVAVAVPLLVGASDGGEDAAAAPYDPPEEMTLAFMFHIDEELAEQDVFYEKEAGSGEVWRPTGATRDMDAPLYAPAEAVPHTPLQTDNVGPWQKGKPLGLTLGDWFAAKGHGSYRCEDGVGTVDLAFENLVADGLYTVWHDFAVWPPTDPFKGFYDLPFGARDGSENAFVAASSRTTSVSFSTPPPWPRDQIRPQDIV